MMTERMPVVTQGFSRASIHSLSPLLVFTDEKQIEIEQKGNQL